MNFFFVAQCFETIETTSGRLDKTALLANLLKNINAEQARMITYLSCGDLYASYENIQFNIADKGLIEVIAVLVEKSSSMIEEMYKVEGDLGLVIQHVWHGADQGKSIEQVYDDLVALAKISGNGSVEVKLQTLVTLLKSLDKISAKYIIRIISKSLRLGFSDMTLIDAFSWMYVSVV